MADLLTSRPGAGKPGVRHPRTVREERVAVLYTKDGIAKATRQALGLVGPMSSILGGRRVAILKPNFVAGRPARTGATTNFEIIAAVAEAVHAEGAIPVLCEFPGTEFDFDATLAILKINEFCRQHEIGLVRRVDRWLELHPLNARRLKRFHIPCQLEDACLINLPVLKTHAISSMSLSMKNLMGLLPRRDRRKMHILGIQQCLVDMNRGLKPDLNIVDGDVGQDRDGPLYGRPANLGVLVAGRDALSVDLACCQLAKIDPSAVGHLKRGIKQLGERRITFVGDKVTNLNRMELPRTSAVYRTAFWLMYLLDYPFAPLTGRHFCAELYKSGLFGTRPRIVPSACTQCGDCVQACPLPDVIDIKNFRVDPRTCERCLLCFESCKAGAIEVKGKTGASIQKDCRLPGERSKVQ